MTHVDDYVDNPAGDPYARWMLMHFRLPAVLQILCGDFLKTKLFCTWQGKRWRVTGASRLGDVWLHSKLNFDPKKTQPYYEERVELDECSEWGPEPGCPKSAT